MVVLVSTYITTNIKIFTCITTNIKIPIQVCLIFLR